MTDRKTLYETWADAEFFLADTLRELAAARGEVGCIAEILAGADGLPDEERWALLREIDRAVSRANWFMDFASAWEREIIRHRRVVCDVENGLTREDLEEMAASCGRKWESLDDYPSRNGASDAT